MRVARQQLAAQAHPREHRGDLVTAGGGAQRGAEFAQRLGHQFPDVHAWIERTEWILENDLQVLADRPQRLALGLEQLRALVTHGSGRRDQPQQRARDARFSTARLADQSQALAAPDGEAHSGDGADSVGPEQPHP
ncbi:MAG TPA: hypothetical protein VK505_09665 [Steroidobacteraceae bacterium]|nr:hypothetical protein [Steroidobacteraceae bacterium]